MLRFFSENSECRTLLVEKTDRLYRNFTDYVKVEDLGISVHLVKEGQIVGRDARSQAKLIHGVQLAVARHHSDNLREEVRKGMQEKAAQGVYPSRPPLGYVNNRLDRTIGVHPENAEIVKRMFSLYANEKYSLAQLRKAIRMETGRTFQKGYLHKILRNPFYSGIFEWNGQKYRGSHPLIIPPAIYEHVQAVLRSHNRPRYRRHDFAFSGLLKCAHDGCAITAERKKEKYTYCRCTGFRGKCELPYLREEELSGRLADILKDIYVPDDVISGIQDSIIRDQNRAQSELRKFREKLQERLRAVRRRIEQAYADKLDGKISENFWLRKNAEWQLEERQIDAELAQSGAPNGERVLNAKRILELANKAYFLYLAQKPAEQAKLLKVVLSNCAIDAVSLYPTYRKPFDIIFRRAESKEWRARRDSNSRPIAPEAIALSS